MVVESIQRNCCVVDGSRRLRHLHIFPHFPVFMGCTDASPENDLLHDMKWVICEDCGTIQLAELIPLPVLYSKSHNSGVVGGLWARHHQKFADFILKYSPKTVLEIGGGHGTLSMLCTEKSPEIDWTILEPNPSPRPHCRARYLRGFFDEEFRFDRVADTLVHSHFFEHLYEPARFLRDLGRFLPLGGKNLFSIPNLPVMLERGYTNCINFEHTYFMGIRMLEALCLRHGFRVIEKVNFLEDHSVFFATERIDVCISPLPNEFDLNLAAFRRYLEHHHLLVKELNSRILSHNGPVYLFGAHVFSQYLVAFGLDTSVVQLVLDNDPMKHGKRLSGTNLNVAGTEILANVKNPLIVLRAGVYNDEVRENILCNINSEAVFV